MLRNTCIMVIFSILLVTSTVFAEDVTYETDFTFIATPIIKGVNQDGEFDHNIYYFAFGDDKCLVIVCHGFVDNDKNYGIFMHNRPRYDYAQAVSESIAYWTRQGEMRNVGDFKYVFINTCYSGYAPRITTLPTYNINLVRAIDYKGTNYFSETPLQNGQVILEFGRVIPNNVISSQVSSALSYFLGKHNVKGYRSVGSRSATKPKGAIILSDEF